MAENNAQKPEFLSGTSKKVFVVAEIGKNFIQTKKNQPVKVYLANAKRLVDEAINAGTDAVKFQTHEISDEHLPIKIIPPHFKESDRYSWIKKVVRATPYDKFWQPLKAYCDKRKILFFSTPMSRRAAQKLENLGVSLWKIGSGDVLDFVMLDFVAGTGKPIIMSTGMSTLSELAKSVAFIKKRNPNLILLHAVSQYPCPIENLNLRTINFLKEKFNLPIGFSDHSLGYESAVAAVALGARVVEKHFSLSRDFWGADHKVSMLPNEFKIMTSAIRRAESDDDFKKRYLKSEAVKKALGRATKILHPKEAVFRPMFRKSLVAARDIPAGKIISADMIYSMRPQAAIAGLNSEHYEKILGKKLKKGLKKFKPFSKTILDET